jgi:hypothetical protein
MSCSVHGRACGARRHRNGLERSGRRVHVPLSDAARQRRGRHDALQQARHQQHLRRQSTFSADYTETILTSVAKFTSAAGEQEARPIVQGQHWRSDSFLPCSMCRQRRVGANGVRRDGQRAERQVHRSNATVISDPATGACGIRLLRPDTGRRHRLDHWHHSDGHRRHQWRATGRAYDQSGTGITLPAPRSPRSAPEERQAALAPTRSARHTQTAGLSRRSPAFVDISNGNGSYLHPRGRPLACH